MGDDMNIAAPSLPNPVSIARLQPKAQKPDIVAKVSQVIHQRPNSGFVARIRREHWKVGDYEDAFAFHVCHHGLGTSRTAPSGLRSSFAFVIVATAMPPSSSSANLHATGRALGQANWAKSTAAQMARPCEAGLRKRRRYAFVSCPTTRLINRRST